MSRTECPSDPEDVAEHFCMHTLPPADRDWFQQHVRDCQPCARVLKDTEIYVEAMRAAAREIRDKDKPK